MDHRTQERTDHAPQKGVSIDSKQNARPIGKKNRVIDAPNACFGRISRRREGSEIMCATDFSGNIIQNTERRHAFYPPSETIEVRKTCRTTCKTIFILPETGVMP